MTLFTGTVASHEALFEQIQADMTGATAAADGTAWTLLYDDYGPEESRMWLQAPGNSSGDDIFLWVRHFRDAGSGYYNLEFLVSPTYDAGLKETPTSLPYDSGYYYLPSVQTSLDYWLMVNEQRIILVQSTASRMSSVYAGWYNPNGLPNEHTAPLFIGAMTGTSTMLHSSDTASHANFWNYTSNNKLLHYDNTWLTAKVWPQPVTSVTDMITTPGGGYMPVECVLYSDSNDGNVYGSLDGMYRISGYLNGAENTFVYDSSTWLVLNDLGRVATDDFACVRLE
jgi:hypothetical protein